MTNFDLKVKNFGGCIYFLKKITGFLETLYKN